MKDGKNKVHPKENDTFFVDSKSMLYIKGKSKLSLGLNTKQERQNICFANINIATSVAFGPLMGINAQDLG